MLLRIASLLTVVIYMTVLPMTLRFSSFCKYYSHYVSSAILDPELAQDFDFIIVGAGSAGSVLANRLSRNYKVFLIEAGGTPFYANHIPALSASLFHMPEVGTVYKTEPQKHACLGQTDHAAYWPRGKLLGGTSNLHSMMYVRGNPLDFDNWANLTGDDSWSYSNVLKYFDRSIDYHGSFPSNYHRDSYYGNQHIESFQRTPFYHTVMEAGKELGFETDIDTNRPQRPGFGPGDAYQRQGKRESSYTAFLEPVLHRENLVISKYSVAIRIKLDQTNTAVGVWFKQHGRLKFVRAIKEVIVSAGSIDSPKLLMHSGIGPKEHLQEIGIKPRVNLPVGQNLKDHLMTFLLPFTMAGPPHYSVERDLGVTDLIEYYTKGTGFLTLPHGSFSQAFFTSKMVNNQSDGWNDFQMAIVHMSPNPYIPSELSRFTKIKQSIFERLYSESGKPDDDGFLVALALGRPKSSGFIKLRSKDPPENPIINPNYLSHPDDMSRFVDEIKTVFNLVECTATFKSVNATYVGVPISECRMHHFNTDGYWKCYVKYMTVTMHHPVGTCSMGKGENDNLAVVDSNLRVLKTRGLRVADASVMPDIPNGNTNAPTVMIAEKAADMIREYWANQSLVCFKFEILLKIDNMCYYNKLA